MSLFDQVLLWLHIAFAMFALGPVAAFTGATPRYIRQKNVEVVRYLHRGTRIFGVLSIGVFLFGALLGRGFLGAPYMSVSMTLFIVSLVLLVVIDRDQATAVRVLSNESSEDDAKAQTGRIAALGGLVSLLWLVILVLMVVGNPPRV